MRRFPLFALVLVVLTIAVSALAQVAPAPAAAPSPDWTDKAAAILSIFGALAIGLPLLGRILTAAGFAKAGAVFVTLGTDFAGVREAMQTAHPKAAADPAKAAGPMALCLVVLALGVSQSGCWFTSQPKTVQDIEKGIVLAIVNGVCGGQLDHALPTPAEQIAIDLACAAARSQIGAAPAQLPPGMFFCPAKPVEASK